LKGDILGFSVVGHVVDPDISVTVFYFASAIHRVTTNLENLGYSGIPTNTENSGNSVQPSGKFVTNKIVSV